MSKLVYKTRGNSSPQGKPRVYFCAHHDDYPKFFDEISEELLAEQNCAVWYLDDPAGEVDLKTHFSDLREMQLFVMPVTTRLLTSFNRALEEEFFFAIEHHIPVLPLMQEEGLAELFNRKCGDLQYLNKNEKDVTALPYKEKLKQYLSSVLVGDELAEKVRAAFDAYVFLSYRKKDRRHAQELMRLIHKNDFCRDIAIWYDEFLTPGEDFNGAIETALEKSGLFAMVVTPNLVNEENYVQSTEFPRAKNLDKPILAAEMVETNRGVLGEQFRGLEQVTDGHDEGALTARLTEMLKGIAISENNDDPEHNFFIGLAYLHGIDVEVDHDRALSLITAAAEAGVVEAIGQLVTMYRNGIGVMRDYNKVVQWKSRKSIAMIKIFQQSHLWKDVVAVWNLQQEIIEDTCELLGKYERAQSVCNYMLSNMKEMLTEFPEREKDQIPVMRFCADLEKTSGKINAKLGEMEAAREAYLRELEYREAIVKLTGYYLDYTHLSSANDSVAELFEAEGNLVEATKYYEASFEIDKTNAERSDKTEVWVCLKDSCAQLQKVYYEMGDKEKAGEYRRQKKDLLLSLLKKREGEPLFCADLYNEVGKMFVDSGSPGDAISWHRMAEELLEGTDSIAEKEKLADVCEAKGDAVKAHGEDAAEGCYLEALRLRTEVVNALGTASAREKKAVSYEKLGEFYVWQKNEEKAKSFFVKAETLFGTLSVKEGGIEAKKGLARVCERLGALTNEKEQYDRAESVWEQIAKDFPTVTNTDLLCEFWRRRAEDAEMRGKWKEAASLYQKAVLKQEDLVRRCHMARIEKAFLPNVLKLTLLYVENGRTRKARRLVEEALVTAESFAFGKEAFAFGFLEALASLCGLLKRYSMALKYSEMAVEMYDKSLEPEEKVGLEARIRDLRERIEYLKNKPSVRIHRRIQSLFNKK